MMFMNRIAMMVTILRNIKFGTVEAVPDRKESTITHAVQNVVRLYKGAGYKVIMILVDGKFSYLKLPMGEHGITVNETSQDEHVGDIEQYIQMIKVHMHASYNTLPFKTIPNQLIIELGKAAIF